MQYKPRSCKLLHEVSNEEVNQLTIIKSHEEKLLNVSGEIYVGHNETRCYR